jgi:hypothetical protein
MRCRCGRLVYSADRGDHPRDGYSAELDARRYAGVGITVQDPNFLSPPDRPHFFAAFFKSRASFSFAAMRSQEPIGLSSEIAAAVIWS